MRRFNIQRVSITMMLCWLGLLTIATTTHAQDESTSPQTQGTESAPEVAPAAADPNQDTTKEQTFEQIVTTLRENEKQINGLYSSIPTGFPQLQIKHMEKIKNLKTTNEALKNQLESAAIREFKLSPQKNRQATQLVFTTLIKKLEATGANPKFDPQGALDLANMMLAAGLGTDPDSPIKFEAVAYQAFLACLALEDYERGQELLKQIEAQGLTLQDSLWSEFTDSKQKWIREQGIRQQEKLKDDLPRVKFETTEGDIVVELFEDHAPGTVGNFISLVESEFYNERSFFLVAPGRVAQTGCPNDNGSGDAGYKIPSEYDREEIRHNFSGSLSMINRGPNTGSSQFMFTHQRNGQLDGKNTVFGRVIEGMDVVYRLKISNKTNTSVQTRPESAESSILSAKVIRKRNHAYTPTPVSDQVPQQPVQPDPPAPSIGSGQ